MAPSGVIPSPNIWNDPATYELENTGVDPDGVIEAAMRRVRDWAGQVVLDIGCGTGFHLPRLAESAARVIGVEPHPPLVAASRERVGALPTKLSSRIQVSAGNAERLPLRPSSIDVVHARWAYFFGPGCEPGLREVARVLRPGGTMFVIDNDATTSTFADWFGAALPDYDPVAIERFWARQGFDRMPVMTRWDFPDRATFERVLRIEFAPHLVQRILTGHPGSGVDYGVNLFHRTF